MDLELKNDILEIKTLLNIMLPKEFSILDIARRTGKSKEAIRKYLQNHFEPEVDYFMKNGKIIVERDVAIKIIQRN